ncbi:hypothetical protein [Tychonema sp. LEGE 07203]|uniref:hypothetical protein n=1 Tax=Tychonema sp. LEGE 07203 TaxID=1828671 RepID=UPI00187E2413|nr:hypothetical protein [Tychonema sp. LEGE 07203]MBE9093438.1 hypothetical protein [Tychonema sp. LEGE 07203]
MNDFYLSPPLSAQFSVVRFTVNSQQSTVNSQQSTVNSQQSTVNSQQSTSCLSATGIDITIRVHPPQSEI